MIKRYKITTQITPTLSGDYDVVAIAVPDDQGDYVRHDAVSHLIEEKSLEQHRAEFEAFQQHDLERCNEGFYIRINTMIAWSVWRAARGVKDD